MESGTLRRESRVTASAQEIVDTIPNISIIYMLLFWIILTILVIITLVLYFNWITKDENNLYSSNKYFKFKKYC